MSVGVGRLAGVGWDGGVWEGTDKRQQMGGVRGKQQEYQTYTVTLD